MSKNKQKNIKQNKMLGSLESEIMDALWQKGKGTVREVANRLKNKKAYTTIMTVMDRLHGKGVLKREIAGHGAYAYLPAQDRQTFYNQVSKKIISSLIAEFGEAAIVQFIDIIENNNDKKIKEWRQKLKALK